jgi:hypothetical protein
MELRGGYLTSFVSPRNEQGCSDVNNVIGVSKMAKFVDFNEMQPQKNNNSILRVKPDCKYKVRLVSGAIEIIRIFSKDRKCAFLENEEIGTELRHKYPGELRDMTTRYACWCLDRDSKSMKILDMPKSVAKSFSNRQVRVGKEIAEYNEGCDWLIDTNGRQGKDVRYETVYLEDTFLTNAEVELVEDQKTGKYGHYDLNKIFKSLNFEEAEKKLFNV